MIELKLSIIKTKCQLVLHIYVCVIESVKLNKMYTVEN